MSSCYIQDNRKYYDQSYANGYGIQYPEGHVIRVYNKILKSELGLPLAQGSTLLDFGCGNGTHAFFFHDRGFEVYGMDISDIAIAACKEQVPGLEHHFLVAKPNPSENPEFGTKFDVVLANQVLYFLSPPDMKAALSYLYQQMNPGAVLIATMMGTQNYYFNHATPRAGETYTVSLPNSKVLNIQFTADKDELVEKFHPFEPMHIGYYDAVISEKEGSGFHFLYVGRKPQE